MPGLKLRMSFDSPLLGPIDEGAIQLDNVDLEIERVPPRERHHRMLHDLEWDICEYSSVNLLTGLDAAGGLPFRAVPVFPQRSFRHRDIWVSESAGITRPADLNGQRIGVQNWDNSAALWQRGPLQQDHGVDLASIQWVCMIPPETQGYQPPAWLRIELLPKGKKLEELLVAGEIAAMMVPFPPQWPEGSEGKYRRLFPDFPAVEQAFWERHRVFPIMHTVVVKNDLLVQHRWLAESVAQGVQRAIDAVVEQKRDGNEKSLIWPSLTWMEQEARVGRHPWPAGLEANRAALETGVSYALEQGLIRRRIDPAELFGHPPPA